MPAQGMEKARLRMKDSSLKIHRSSPFEFELTVEWDQWQISEGGLQTVSPAVSFPASVTESVPAVPDWMTDLLLDLPSQVEKPGTQAGKSEA